MIARDEEANIRRALDSSCLLANEIIVGVDSRTIDHTADIARSFGADVFPFHWDDNFSFARNKTLLHAHGDWILTVDADDVYQPEAFNWIPQVLANKHNPFYGYALRVEERRNDESVISSGYSSIRLFRNMPDLSYAGRIHEEVMYQWNQIPDEWAAVLGVDKPLFLHYGYDPSRVTAKDQRNLDLLCARLNDCPDDPKTFYYLACHHAAFKRMNLAADYARTALSLGRLPPAHTALLQKIIDEHNTSEISH